VIFYTLRGRNIDSVYEIGVMHNFSNIPASSAYGVNFSQPIRCAQYSDQSSVADTKMLEQGYIDLDLNHRYTNSTVVMTIWLTVTKYANLK
jgi:hypothetical protein